MMKTKRKCIFPFSGTQSYPDKFAVVQILSYLSNAYLEQIKAGNKELIPVIPMLFYHGKKNGSIDQLLS
ncbi:MAG: Rpn family recombination-promoting nuclease/putative transposase [Saprospiraceae bacterium]